MILRALTPDDWDEQARLIHASLSTWYRTRLNSDKFGEDPTPFRVFPELYEALDPGCCLVSQDSAGSPLTGSVFYHPRETHWAVGIVNTHPAAAGRGVARALMEEVIQRAGSIPVRLVSSAMNLDSFSLYTRLGFVPRMTFQDLRLEIPTHGLPPHNTGDLHIRPATPDDIDRLADLELELNGIRRAHDLAHFVTNAAGCWRLYLAESSSGSLKGFLGAIHHPASRMLGPGVCTDEATAAALIHHTLNADFRGCAPVWLVPVHCGDLVRTCYQWGARNVELHLASVRGSAPPLRAVTLPTFLPESG
ncbi:MAG: hypothetical protein RLZZ179_802 [Verrucomicrobiota bacterium]|jgi:GNAT superfamily N-acetyltransferase